MRTLADVGRTRSYVCRRAAFVSRPSFTQSMFTATLSKQLPHGGAFFKINPGDSKRRFRAVGQICLFPQVLIIASFIILLPHIILCAPPTASRAANHHVMQDAQELSQNAVIDMSDARSPPCVMHR